MRSGKTEFLWAGLGRGEFLSPDPRGETWIVNNTIADNIKYGLSVVIENLVPSIPDPATGEIINKDGKDYSFENLYIINNLFAYNTGDGGTGIQVFLWNQLENQRGYYCSLVMNHNAYINPKSASEPVIDLQVVSGGVLPEYAGGPLSTGHSVEYTVDEFQWLSFFLKGIQGRSGCHVGPLGGGDVQFDPDPAVDPVFANRSANDYHLSSPVSRCMGKGTMVSLAHYEHGSSISIGPDYDGEMIFNQPDIGADEVVLWLEPLIKLSTTPTLHEPLSCLQGVCHEP